MYFSQNKEKISKNYLLFALVAAAVEFVVNPIATAAASGFFTSWLLGIIAPLASVYFWAVAACAIFAALIINGKGFKGIERVFTVAASFVLIATFVTAFNNIFGTVGNAVRASSFGLNGAKFYNWGGMVAGFIQLGIIGYFIVITKYYKILAEQIKEIISAFSFLKKQKTEVAENSAADSEPAKEATVESPAIVEEKTVAAEVVLPVAEAAVPAASEADVPASEVKVKERRATTRIIKKKP